MKKIYIVGKFDYFIQTLNTALAEEFQVQLCSDNLEIVKGILSLGLPDLVLFCTNGLTEEHLQIAEHIREHYIVLPVLCIGNMEGLSLFAEYRGVNGFESLNLENANPLESIKECVYRILGMNKPAAGNGSASAWGYKKRILLIDDSAVALRAVKGILENEYEVDMAKSAIEALKHLSQNIPDLIFLDYDMPDCDGKETLQLVRANDLWKHIPVVFLTSVQDRNRINAVLSLNPAGYILKPVDRNKLYRKINEIFSGN